jgi:hypothetical protein
LYGRALVNTSTTAFLHIGSGSRHRRRISSGSIMNHPAEANAYRASAEGEEDEEEDEEKKRSIRKMVNGVGGLRNVGVDALAKRFHNHRGIHTRYLMAEMTRLENPTSLTVDMLSHTCEMILLHLYGIAMEKEIINEADRQVVGPLLHVCLPALRWYMNWLTNVCHNETYKMRYVCAARSGLQFLLDDYGAFPTYHHDGSGGTLETPLTLWRAQAQVDLIGYDAQFVQFTPVDDYSWDSEEFYHEAQQVPPHHVWWTALADNMMIRKKMNECVEYV